MYDALNSILLTFSLADEMTAKTVDRSRWYVTAQVLNGLLEGRTPRLSISRITDFQHGGYSLAVKREPNVVEQAMVLNFSN